VNYLSLLGWSLSADRDVFDRAEMVEAFDVVNVNPNPARFDLKKAEAINGDHIRKLTIEDFTERCVPYLAAAGLLSDPVTEAEREILTAIAPHVQERVALLGEVPPMIAFLFTEDQDIVISADAHKTLGDTAPAVLAAAIEALEAVPSWSPESLEQVLRAALVEGLELSPRHAFGPIRVAISGQRVSPPLFESMEVLGRESSLTRLRALMHTL